LQCLAITSTPSGLGSISPNLPKKSLTPRFPGTLSYTGLSNLVFKLVWIIPAAERISARNVYSIHIRVRLKPIGEFDSIVQERIQLAKIVIERMSICGKCQFVVTTSYF
jgi:hypothetical protein